MNEQGKEAKAGSKGITDIEKREQGGKSRKNLKNVNCCFFFSTRENQENKKSKNLNIFYLDRHYTLLLLNMSLLQNRY